MKTKVRQLCVQDLLYADDTGFVSHSEVDLQMILDRFSAASASFGLAIKVRKLRSCINPLPGHRTQHRRSCSMVRHLTSQRTVSKELSARIQSASAAFDYKMQGLPCYHPVMSSVQFRDIHDV